MYQNATVQANTVMRGVVAGNACLVAAFGVAFETKLFQKMRIYEQTAGDSDHAEGVASPWRSLRWGVVGCQG